MRIIWLLSVFFGGKIDKPFRLKNAYNLTYKFLKVFIQNSCVKFDEFPDKIVYLFFLKMEVLRSESVNAIINRMNINDPLHC